MKKLIMFSLLAVIFFAVPLKAQRHKKDDTPPRHRLMAELNLTDQQKDQFDKLRTEHQNRAIDLKASIAKLRLQVKDAMKEKNIDEGKVLSLTKKISDLQSELKSSSVSLWIKSYNLLDDKQKEIWREHQPMHRDGMGRHGKHMKERIHKRMHDDSPFHEED